MMSVKEYADDVSVSVSHILKLCDKLNIAVNNENDSLSEDDIIMLDDELARDEDIEEENFFEEETLKDLKINETTKDKMKPKAVSNKDKAFSYQSRYKTFRQLTEDRQIMHD